MALLQEKCSKEVASFCDMVGEKSATLEMTLRQACHEDEDQYQLSLKQKQ